MRTRQLVRLGLRTFRAPGRLASEPNLPIGDAEAERLATYPPPYPAGWYVAARAAEVTSRPRVARVAGKDLVLFRTEEGVRSVSAYCPHLGAHLGQGRVLGDCIECPFHRWRIDGAGRVRHLPGDDAPTRRHATTSQATQDLHGWICVYHGDTSGELGEIPEPPYQLQRVLEIDSGELLFRGEKEIGTVRMHLLEFAENSVDFQHFSSIHGQLTVPWFDLPLPGLTVHHQARWYRDPEESHVAWFENDARVGLGERALEGTGAMARIRLEGPGGVVRFDFDLRGHGRVVLFQSHTPEGPLLQRVRFRWFSERRVPSVVANFIVGSWVSQWRQDISIWQSKVYRARPVMSRGDGPIHQLRHWYSQFYPADEVLEHGSGEPGGDSA